MPFRYIEPEVDFRVKFRTLKTSKCSGCKSCHSYWQLGKFNFLKVSPGLLCILVAAQLPECAGVYSDASHSFMG